MKYAEHFALPLWAEIGRNFAKKNDFGEVFYLRWGNIQFQVFWGVDVNVKVILKVYRQGNVCETFIVDTTPYAMEWNRHKRMTQDFYIHGEPLKLGELECVRFSYIVHWGNLSIPSDREYTLIEAVDWKKEEFLSFKIVPESKLTNTYRTYEVDGTILQHAVEDVNENFNDLSLVPKFTKGRTYHPYHPKQFIHNKIDEVVEKKTSSPQSRHTIQVCVDCIDDTDFANHLLYAHRKGVIIQCIVDWRKTVLTNSDNYVRLKKTGVELLGVFCTPKHELIEVAPDMHNKFILFDDEDAILGSFNITFDKWGGNWESGMTFHSKAVSLLLRNIFESVRGGLFQGYTIDHESRFSLLYTFGSQHLADGKSYLPHHAIFSAISQARTSIHACLFILGELMGEYQDSIVDALIAAHRRGCKVELIFNGHLAREGNNTAKYSMADELKRPLLPAIARLKENKIPIYLVYDHTDRPVPYSPLHAKYCIVDESIVIDGSFNWYNTSVFSHDILTVVRDKEVAEHYLYEWHEILKTFRVYV